MAAATEILRLLPQPRPDDPPELAQALAQAYDLWSRGRRSDAVTMLRGAIVSAAEGGAPDRANDLARQVTELVNALHGPPAPPPKLDRPSGTMAKPPPPPPRSRIPAANGRADTGPRAIVVTKEQAQAQAQAQAQTQTQTQAQAQAQAHAQAQTQAQAQAQKPAEKSTSRPATGVPDVDDASWSDFPPRAETAAAPPSPPSPPVSNDEPPPTRPGGEEKIEAKKEEGAFGPIDLSKVEVLADVPDDALAALIDRARPCKLAVDERIDAPALIVVLDGELEIGVAGREPAVEIVRAGQARILAPPKPSRDALIVTAVHGGARYLAVDGKGIEALKASAPWVVSELGAGCDALHALAGVLAGPLGRELTTERVAELRARCESRRLAKNALIIKKGEPVRGLLIVGAGAIVGDAGDAPLSAGDVVLGEELVEGTTAPSSFRAGPEGALLLVARRPQTKAFLAQPEWAKLLRGA